MSGNSAPMSGKKNMANGNTNPMERVKMLNMREESMLRKELENIHVLEKKKLHLLNKDTINLRMELRAHRFRAMKTSVRQKGALQEFDEKWKERMIQTQMDPRARREFIGGAHPEVRESFINQTRHARHSAGSRDAPTPSNKTPTLQTGLSKSSEAFYPRPPTSQRSHTPVRRKSAQVRPPANSQQHTPQNNLQTPTVFTPDLRTRSPVNSNRGVTPESRSPTLEPPPVRRQSTWTGSSRSPSLLSAVSRGPSDVASTTSSSHRRKSVVSSRRKSYVQHGRDSGSENAYLTRLVQSIAGGSSGAKVACEKGGKDPSALLDKLKQHTFDQYTDGSLAMEMRKLRQKKMSVNPQVHVTGPEDLLPPSQRGQPTTPHRPHPPRTAPPEGRSFKRPRGTGVFHAWRRQNTVVPRMPIVRKKKTYDSDDAFSEDNEGLLRLHREGQKQEYEKVLRRVNRFLGKPNKAECVINRDDLSREDILLLNKVRPPKRRLKGAVKLVLFLNKAKGMSLLGKKKSNKVEPREGLSTDSGATSQVNQGTSVGGESPLNRLQTVLA